MSGEDKEETYDSNADAVDYDDSHVDLQGNYEDGKHYSPSSLYTQILSYILIFKA